MIALKDLLKSLSSNAAAKVELMSGRRPRVVSNGEVKNLGDEILMDDEVVELCRQAGGGRRLDDLGDKPVSWTYASSIGPLHVTAGTRGREIFATLSPVQVTESPSVRPREATSRDTAPRDSATKRGMKAIRKASRELEATRSQRQTDAPARSKRTVPDVAIPRSQNVDPARVARRPSSPGVTRRDIPSRRGSDASAKRVDPLKLDDVGEAHKVDHQRTDRGDTKPRPGFAAPEVTLPSAGPVSSGLLAELIEQAKKAGASDLHLSTGRAPDARTALGLSALPNRGALSRTDVDRILSALVPDKLLPKLSDTGGVSFATSLNEATRLRVNATTTLEGPKLALRLLHGAPPTFEDLGLPEELVRVTDQPQGLVVVTGSSGQGKTTTIAALVEKINRTRAAHVITVEDPIEIPITSKRAIVSQREIGAHAKSFERALKGALRQDPDVIVIGELRDVETVRIALTASETGHLVLGTMNTPSTKSVIDRLIDLFPPGDQPQVRHTLAGGLRMICNQRLLPRADGKGRVAAFELVPGSTALWNLIREDKTYQVPSLIQRGKGANISRMVDAIAALIRRGAVDRLAAISLADDVDELTKLLDGPAAASPTTAASPERPGEEAGLTSLLNRAGALFGRRGGGS